LSASPDGEIADLAAITAAMGARSPISSPRVERTGKAQK
jgi:hypothetical protein